MGDQLGMARVLSVAWAQLWLTCLCPGSLASFVQAGESHSCGTGIEFEGGWEMQQSHDTIKVVAPSLPHGGGQVCGEVDGVRLGLLVFAGFSRIQRDSSRV